MVYEHALCTPPGRRVVHDQLEAVSMISTISSLISSLKVALISFAGITPVSYTWRRWRS